MHFKAERSLFAVLLSLFTSLPLIGALIPSAASAKSLRISEPRSAGTTPTIVYVAALRELDIAP